MPKRAKSRFSMKKSSKSRSAKLEYVGGDPGAPTEEEWANMVTYGGFVIRDDDDEEHNFKKMDIVRIVPAHLDAEDNIAFHEFWVAKIKDIRARENGDVYARVRWYYSGEDIAGLVKSFKASNSAKYERFLSDQEDFVESHCFDGLATVQSFDETSIDQLSIPKSTYFCRYSFDHVTGAIHKYIAKPDTKPKAKPTRTVKFTEGEEEASSSAGLSALTTRKSKRKLDDVDSGSDADTAVVQPLYRLHQERARASTPTQPGIISTCSCRKPYNPDTDCMHFCACCQKSFHARCLGLVWIDHMSVEERELKLIASLPSSDWENGAAKSKYLELLASTPTTVTKPLTITVPAAKPKRGRPRQTKALSGGRPTRKGETQPPAIWIPAELRFLASQQIVRGIGAGGVAGNVRIIVRARRMMHAALTGVEKVSIGWRDVLEDGDAIGSVDAAERAGRNDPTRGRFLCPSCGEPI